MSHRRIYETIGVRYDDIDRVPIILAEIREYLIGSHGGEIAFPTRTLHVAGDVHLAGLPAERRRPGRRSSYGPGTAGPSQLNRYV